MDVTVCMMVMSSAKQCGIFRYVTRCHLVCFRIILSNLVIISFVERDFLRVHDQTDGSAAPAVEIGGLLIPEVCFTAALTRTIYCRIILRNYIAYYMIIILWRPLERPLTLEIRLCLTKITQLPIILSACLLCLLEQNCRYSKNLKIYS